MQRFYRLILAAHLGHVKLDATEVGAQLVADGFCEDDADHLARIYHYGRELLKCGRLPVYNWKVNNNAPFSAQGNEEQLMDCLKGLGVIDSDLAELSNALQGDGYRSEKNFGPRVNQWLGQMLSKAAEGTRKTALATAPTLLTGEHCGGGAL